VITEASTLRKVYAALAGMQGYAIFHAKINNTMDVKYELIPVDQSNKNTIEGLKESIKLQIDSVNGWLSIGSYELALIKANCLVDDLKKFIEINQTQSLK